MKVQSKKLNPPFSIKTNGREDAKEIIELLVLIGFKSNEFWNREQLKEQYYDKNLDKGFVNVNSENVIELHTHSCNNDVISRKHLLKEIPKPEYDPKDVAFNQSKVIGYKLIKSEYKKAVNALISEDKDSNWILENIVKYGNALWEDLNETGVLDIWFEEVYENSITLESGVKLSEDDIEEVKEILKNK